MAHVRSTKELPVYDTLNKMCSTVPSGSPCGEVKSDVGNDSVCFRTRTSNTMSHAEFSRTFTQIAVRRVTVEQGAHLLIVDARAEGMV